jgi:hypothetical protein
LTMAHRGEPSPPHYGLREVAFSVFILPINHLLE